MARPESLTAERCRLVRRFLQLTDSGAIAVRDSETQLTFQTLGHHAASLATALVAAQLANRRVGLLAPPGCAWTVGFWATQLAGATCVPLSPLYPERELSRLLQAARAEHVLCPEPHAAALSGLDVELIPLPELASSSVPAVGLAALPVVTLRPPALELNLAPGSDQNEARDALLLFTSGTTGLPKAVPIESKMVFDGVRVLAECWGFQVNDVLLHMLPLHHLHGICVALLTPMLSGAQTRFVTPFVPEAVLNSLAECSVLMGVPTQYHRLLETLEQVPATQRRALESDLAGLRLITSGSAKLPDTLAKRLRKITGQYPLERYGMTEVGIVLSNLPGDRRLGCCGRPLPGVEARITTETGAEAHPGEPGELHIKAPTVFRGYDGDADATADAFNRDFFKTGDTATWTADGFVKILGRTSVDIIKSGGYKLSALEIEDLLRDHPFVDDVAVVGVADERWGEAVVAVVVPRSEARAELGEAIRDWACQRTAPYKVPRRFVFRSELPRNALGKVNKKELLGTLSSL